MKAWVEAHFGFKFLATKRLTQRPHWGQKKGGKKEKKKLDVRGEERKRCRTNPLGDRGKGGEEGRDRPAFVQRSGTPLRGNWGT